uniref:Xylanase inhibitor N-terminal domain-containing protein n=1 Tax=Nelumbo nucifera TaxID=4432 RepID=A0A822XPM8_NELNU|nr:TPA_asm: hypothetical protein HUJ06_020901 [Nelumbo nucifera]
MVDSLWLLVFTIAFILVVCNSEANKSSQPHTLILPITKDACTRQYLTHIRQRTPLVVVKLDLHLSGKFLLVECDSRYNSSSYRVASCDSDQCKVVGRWVSECGDCYSSPRPSCNNNTCIVIPDSPIILLATIEELTQDVIKLRSTARSKTGPIIRIPDFLFSC